MQGTAVAVARLAMVCSTVAEDDVVAVQHVVAVAESCYALTGRNVIPALHHDLFGFLPHIFNVCTLKLRVLGTEANNTLRLRL